MSGNVARADTYAHPSWAAGIASRPASRVNPVVQAALYVFILSIPFEMPNRTIPIEIPTLTGAILLACTVLHPTACFRRIPAALGWFAAYLWIFVAVVLVLHLDHPVLAFRLLLGMVQLVLLLWVVFNLLADDQVLRHTLVALVVACVARAAIQVFGIAATSHAVYTGGERVTALGQNANISAMILSAGLVVLVGLQSVAHRRLPRFGLLTWPLAGLIGMTIIQSGSRGGLLCVLVGLAGFSFRGATALQQMRNGLLTLAALGLLAWAAAESTMMRNRVENAEEGQLAGREVIYPTLLEMFRERPILGWGPIDNQFELAKRIEDPKYVQRDAHNLVLELLTTTGMVGAAPFLIGLALCIGGAWRARRGPLGIIPFAMLSAVLVGTISGTWIASKILWFVMAVALAAGRFWATPSPSLRGAVR